MNSHWASKYIGQPWSFDCNCYEWFRRITKEQFNRELPVLMLPQDHLTRRAAKIMNNQEEYFGYKPTDKPKEGDAVFLSGNNKTSHHIGMVIFIKNKMMVLHAISEVGVVVSKVRDLKINNLRIQGFWAWQG